MLLLDHFTGEGVSIRKGNDQDIDFICQAENSPENAPFVNQWKPQEHYNLMQQPTALYLILQSKEGQPGGFVILNHLNGRHKNIELKRIIITDKGKGYGRRFLKSVKHLVFNELQCHRLWLDVVESNLRAKLLYESEGFRVEGLMRECWYGLDGTYQSMYFMSILAQEYRA